MAFNKSKGKMEPNKGAGAPANKVTLGPGGSFPAGDAKHQRLAISGATRSENAGNISAATAASIKAKARKMLGENKPAKPRSMADSLKMMD